MLHGQNKKTFKLPTCRAEEDAQERSALLAQQARRLRQSRHMGSKAADVLLDELALARPGAVSDVLQVIGELCGGVGVAEPPKPTGPTFNDVAKAWLSGELHAQFPHHIDTPSEDWAALVRQRLDRAVYPVIGDIPIAKLTREQCDDVMRRLALGILKHVTNTQGYQAAIALPSVTRLDSKFPRLSAALDSNTRVARDAGFKYAVAERDVPRCWIRHWGPLNFLCYCFASNHLFGSVGPGN